MYDATSIDPGLYVPKQYLSTEVLYSYAVAAALLPVMALIIVFNTSPPSLTYLLRGERLSAVSFYSITEHSNVWRYLTASRSHGG